MIKRECIWIVSGLAADGGKLLIGEPISQTRWIDVAKQVQPWTKVLR